MIDIKMWMDIACPYCYIGEKHLFTALKNMGIEDKTKFSFKSFQLDPNAPLVPRHTVYEYLSNKYSVSLAEAKNMTLSVVASAHEAGLKINFDNLKQVNTFNAHRLVHMAQEKNIGSAVALKLFEAFFVTSKNVADNDILIDIAVDCGLNKGEVTQMLQSDKYKEDVLADEKFARELNIRVVPTYLINDKTKLSGAIPAAEIEKQLKSLL